VKDHPRSRIDEGESASAQAPAPSDRPRPHPSAPPFQIERSRTELSRLGSSLPPRASFAPSIHPDAPNAELLLTLRDLRQRCREVAAIFDGLVALRSMGAEEALIEMALFAQSHEQTIDDMWRSLSQCEQAALAHGHEPGRATLIGTLVGERDPAASQPPPRTDPAALAAPPAFLEDHDEDNPITQVDFTPSRVLIVDDDPAVLRAFRRVLSSAHQVLTARDGAEALRIVLGDAAPDAIICDLGMPKLDGPTFFTELFELRPQLMPRVVFCTGGTPSDTVQRVLERMQAPVLRKPVAASDLLGAVESVRAR
jgi:CheY-like chemotaxis protein